MSSDFFCDVCFRGQQKFEKKPQSDSLTHSSSQKGREEDEDDVMMSPPEPPPLSSSSKEEEQEEEEERNDDEYENNNNNNNNNNNTNNDTNRRNPLLGVNDDSFDFEQWLLYESNATPNASFIGNRRQRKRKDIERAIVLMESRTRKNLKELSDTQESLEKFKGKKPEIVLKFLRELTTSLVRSKSKSNTTKNEKKKINGRDEEEDENEDEEDARRDWFDQKTVNVLDERMMAKVVNENVMAFQSVRRKVERETFAEEKRAWMEKRRKEREKEHIAKRKKGKVNNVTYASRLEAARIGRIDDSFWKVKTKEEDKNNQQRPKAVANKQKQKAANATKAKDAEEQDTIAWESEEVADGVQALREYIKELGGSGNLIQAKDWVIKKWTRTCQLKSGKSAGAYKTYHRSDGSSYRSRKDVARALGLVVQ